MKIVVFGLTITSSWGNGHATPYRALLRALTRMGHDVHFFEKDVAYYRSHRDFLSSDHCRITLYEDWAEVQCQALHEAAMADVVITASYVPEGRQINDAMLNLDRPLRVFYDLDTPITLHNLEAGIDIDYLRHDQIAGFDMVLSFVGGNILKELEENYGARLVRPLYGCVDPDDYQQVESRADLASDLSYMATYAADRQEKVDELFLETARRHPQKRFLLAGSMYPENISWPQNVHRIEHLRPEDHAVFYSSSRITLNITRGAMANNGWCPSGRFFEAMACGTPVISDWWEGLDWFFDVVRDLRVVSRSEHVENVLSMSKTELLALAAHARERTLEEHTGAVRARQLLQYLEEASSVTVLKSEVSS